MTDSDMENINTEFIEKIEQIVHNLPPPHLAMLDLLPYVEKPIVFNYGALKEELLCYLAEPKLGYIDFIFKHGFAIRLKDEPKQSCVKIYIYSLD